MQRASGATSVTLAIFAVLGIFHQFLSTCQQTSLLTRGPATSEQQAQLGLKITIRIPMSAKKPTMNLVHGNAVSEMGQN